MALTESTMLQLGSRLPEFSLPDVSTGNIVSSNDFAGSSLVVAFICNHCPYVIHISEALARVAKEYEAAGVKMIAVSSNDAVAYPADSPEKMQEEVESRGYSFPYLYDESQEVALAFTAACTPDFFLFDADHELVYRGRFDETRPTRIKSGVYESDVTAHGGELTSAVKAIQEKTPVSGQQLPSLGCNIKWKTGNEPQY